MWSRVHVGGLELLDHSQHYAKVRVVGPNPVVRSEESPGRSIFPGPARVADFALLPMDHHLISGNPMELSVVFLPLGDRAKSVLY